MEYKGRYWSMSDSLFNLKEFNKVKNARFSYEINRDYHKITVLTADKKQKETQINMQRKILIIISISLLAFIGLLIIVDIQKKKLNNAYKDLYKHNSGVLLSEKQNKELRIIYENKLAEYEQKASSSELMKDKSLPELDDQTEKEEIKSYSTSKLTELQKKELLKRITDVMENPDEFCDCDFSLERLATLVNSNSRYVSQT